MTPDNFEAAAPAVDLDALRAGWAAQWPAALALWSKFTRLSDPRWCLDADAAKAEGLSESFAMIRLNDQAVVIGLHEIDARGLERFALEILAHEIGHALGLKHDNDPDSLMCGAPADCRPDRFAQGRGDIFTLLPGALESSALLH